MSTRRISGSASVAACTGAVCARSLRIRGAVALCGEAVSGIAAGVGAGCLAVENIGLGVWRADPITAIGEGLVAVDGRAGRAEVAGTESSSDVPTVWPRAKRPDARMNNP